MTWFQKQYFLMKNLLMNLKKLKNQKKKQIDKNYSMKQKPIHMILEYFEQ